MQLHDHPLIFIDPAINNGQPTIKDTGLTVAFIVERVVTDGNTQWLLEAYPQLTKETIAEDVYRPELS